MRRRSGWVSLLVTAGVGAILVTSLPAAGAATPAAGRAAGPVLPNGNAKFDYQIGRAYDLPKGVKVVSRDREAKPAKNAYNVCYVNAYQTQPQEIHWWKQHHNNLLLKKQAAATSLTATGARSCSTSGRPRSVTRLRES